MRDGREYNPHVHVQNNERQEKENSPDLMILFTQRVVWQVPSEYKQWVRPTENDEYDVSG